MTIQQCKYILKIIECGSLNEASRQLFVAQSTLSVCVKTVEQELNIKLFERSGNGVVLTVDGSEFARHARQLVEQSDFILARFGDKTPCKRLYVSTQHYDFVADVFAKLVGMTQEDRYRFSLREIRTHEVILDTETAACDVGVIAIKHSDLGVMERYIGARGLSFTPVLSAKPHVYLRQEHPLAGKAVICAHELERFPCVVYDQGDHGGSLFSEELGPTDSRRQVEVSDRASLMNVLLTTDSYMTGTGIMPSSLNQGRIVSVPFENEDHYVIGYLLRTDRTVSSLTQTFLDMLHESISGDPA